MEFVFRTFNPSSIPTKTNHPETFFLRGISPLKVSPPQDDARRLVACHPCGCQAGGGVAAERMTVVMFLCYNRRGWVLSTVSWAFSGSSGHTQVIVVVRVNPGWAGSVKR